MADMLNEKPLKSFYHKSTVSDGKMKHYLTPLERKAIRDIRNIELENKFLDNTPMKDDKENIKTQKNSIKSTNRRLYLKTTKTAKENKQSTPKKMAVRKYNWAPKSLGRSYFKDHWISKTSKTKIFLESPKLKSIMNLSYDNLNRSLPNISNEYPQDDNDCKSSSFCVKDDVSDEIEAEPPAKMRKIDTVHRDTTSIVNLERSVPAEEIKQLKTQKDKSLDHKNSTSKFFPIFNKHSVKENKQTENCDQTDNEKSQLISPITPENLSSTLAGNHKAKNNVKKSSPPSKQMIIDAGQKRFGATQCSMCGMVYSANHPDDEQDHINYHKRFLNFVKFLGWKNERIVSSFMDGRIIKVTPNDPKYAVKKVADILTIVDIDLGFKTVKTGLVSSRIAYFFISDTEKIAGCLIAEKISGAHRLIPGKSTEESSAKNVLCFTDHRLTPAVCGVSRIWTYGPMRRKQIATRLLDAVRSSFVLGSCLDKSQVAFSDPTPDGRAFATKYFGTPNILVYNFLR
ncbi:N-acetyltransferase ESCO2-like [Styela clava]